MYCPNCGKFCAENQTFCLGCGSPLQSDAKNQTLDFDINNYTASSKFGESNPNEVSNQNIQSQNQVQNQNLNQNINNQQFTQNLNDNIFIK